VGPEAFLEENLETLRVSGLYFVYHSFVFDLVERTSGVEHLSAGFESSESSIQKLGLESRDGVDILEIPVLDRLGFLESDPFSRTGRIQKDAIERLRQIAVISSVVIGDHDAVVSQSLGILHQLCHTIPCRLVGDDDRIWKVFGELGGFSSWACGHIKDEERVISSSSRFSPHPQPLSFSTSSPDPFS